mgnify:CR=1 FL=1
MPAWVLAAPRLRLARLWAAEQLASLADEVRGVALPYPRELETPVRRFVQGLIGWEELVARVRREGLPYVDVWSWTEEPLLRGLRSLASSGYELRVECYGPPLAEEARASWELTRLILRVRVTGRVELEAWRGVVGSGSAPAREGFATLSLRPAGPRSIVWGYPFPPSDALSAETLSEEGVRAMVDYIFRYVVTTSNPDEAYLRWLRGVDAGLASELEELARTLGLVRREEEQGP